MKVKVKAKLKNLRISPRKVRISADMVRDCNVGEAIFRLENTTKRSNEPVKNLIKSAIANAQNNFDLNADDLRVADIQVGEGITLKRWIPRAYGRATQILKRSSHVYVILEADKGTKKSVDTKAKVEKKESTKSESVDRAEGKEETVEKVSAKGGFASGEEGNSASKNSEKGYFEAESKRKESREKGWAKKIYRKKSI